MRLRNNLRGGKRPVLEGVVVHRVSRRGMGVSGQNNHGIACLSESSGKRKRSEERGTGGGSFP